MDEEQPQALSLDDFGSLLSQTEQPPAESESAEPLADTPETEEAPSEPAPDDEPEADGEQPKAESPDERVIEWQTQSGEAFKVTERELRDGYMRQQAFTQSTQALGEERRQAQARINAQFEEVRAFAGEIGALHAVNAQLAQYDTLDWDALRTSDPVQFQTLSIEQMRLQHKANTLQQAYQQKAGQRQAEQAGAARESREKGLARLQKDIPGFDANKVAELRSYAVGLGFAAGALDNVHDPLEVLLLHKAQQWDALQAKKPDVANKLKALPPKTASKAGSSAPPKGKQEQLINAVQNKRTFSQNEFAALLRASR